MHFERPRQRRLPLAAALVAILGGIAPATAAAQADDGQSVAPAYSATVYYGPAIGGNLVLNADQLCSAGTSCVLGNGYGVTLFGGVRFAPIFAVELAYDAFWHSSGDLFQLAVLQALRFDVKVFFPTQTNVEPFVFAGASLSLYGDQFRADTYGFGFEVGVGGDVAISELVSIGAVVAYRGIRFQEFTADGRPYGTSLVSTLSVGGQLTVHPDFQPLGRRPSGP